MSHPDVAVLEAAPEWYPRELPAYEPTLPPDEICELGGCLVAVYADGSRHHVGAPCPARAVPTGVVR